MVQLTIALVLLGLASSSGLAFVVPVDHLRRQDTSDLATAATQNALSALCADSLLSTESLCATTAASSAPTTTISTNLTPTTSAATAEKTDVEYWCQPILDYNNLDAIRELWEDKHVGQWMGQFTSESVGGSPDNWPYRMANESFKDLNLGIVGLGVCVPLFVQLSMLTIVPYVGVRCYRRDVRHRCLL